MPSGGPASGADSLARELQVVHRGAALRERNQPQRHCKVCAAQTLLIRDRHCLDTIPDLRDENAQASDASHENLHL